MYYRNDVVLCSISTMGEVIILRLYSEVVICTARVLVLLAFVFNDVYLMLPPRCPDQAHGRGVGS